MRAAAIAFAIALALAPSAAFAQAGAQGGAAGPPPSGPGAAAAPPPGAISRDQFVQRHAEAAGRLFDQIDTNHTGYITRAQLLAFMRARHPGGPPAPGGPAPQH